MSAKPPALFWWMRLGCAWGMASERSFLTGPIPSPRLELFIEGIGPQKSQA
jgi:hypothetical protein